MKYNAEYFIKKFEAIPEDQWAIGTYINSKGQSCALGHCGRRALSTTQEALALTSLVSSIMEINDGIFYSDLQTSAKQRVLRALQKL